MVPEIWKFENLNRRVELLLSVEVSRGVQGMQGMPGMPGMPRMSTIWMILLKAINTILSPRRRCHSIKICLNKSYKHHSLSLSLPAGDATQLNQLKYSIKICLNKSYKHHSLSPLPPLPPLPIRWRLLDVVTKGITKGITKGMPGARRDPWIHFQGKIGKI